MTLVRKKILIRGAVQGVGFRPFVFRLAQSLGLKGLVRNTLQGLSVEIEGAEPAVVTFVENLTHRHPPSAVVQSVDIADIPAEEASAFCIQPSHQADQMSTSMPKDRVPCNTCLVEMLDRDNRRYHYPFITCNDCGPRFSITESLPFDRPNTAMRHFPLCHLCEVEYADPLNRRFHAQTMSCPDCGPKLSYNGEPTHAIARARSDIAAGKILAVKGIGGYQLVCDARADFAVGRIRAYKRRQSKPFAVMAPDLVSVESFCELTDLERSLIQSPAGPVVIVYAKGKHLGNLVAPGLPTLGVMLPSSPLHHLLMQPQNLWLVVTSANRSGEPMITNDKEAVDMLTSCVDGVLSHNRPIEHLVDDSVIRGNFGNAIVIRHARGLAPTEFGLAKLSEPLLAVGGHSKSAFALTSNGRAILSQHIGTLASQSSIQIFNRERESFQKIFCGGKQPAKVIHDEHPLYGSSQFAMQTGLPHRGVFHHVAHLKALQLENSFCGTALGLSWDGTGLGEDGSIWGGEFFAVDGVTTRHIGGLKPFILPGGEVAIMEPRRSALGLLYSAMHERAFDTNFFAEMFSCDEKTLLRAAIEKNLNTPLTSSIGRLFDGLGVLMGLPPVADYEAQLPMLMEHLAYACEKKCDRSTQDEDPSLRFPVTSDQGHGWRLDWTPVVLRALEMQGEFETAKCLQREALCHALHLALAAAAVELAVRNSYRTILASGGAFQNALLVKILGQKCCDAGIEMIVHKGVPPGDGGLALGQLAAELLQPSHGESPQCV